MPFATLPSRVECNPLRTNVEAVPLSRNTSFARLTSMHVDYGFKGSRRARQEHNNAPRSDMRGIKRETSRSIFFASHLTCN